MWIEELPSGNIRAGYMDPAERRRKVQRTFRTEVEARTWATEAERVAQLDAVEVALADAERAIANVRRAVARVVSEEAPRVD